ncbi:hypothetical protein [Pontibacter beigongshangensis]|uniref:hypothetical protein n=1 Tax=Pontibacter beigongshangensis TaxID=2574733 RepID=UPI00164F2A51|nr:hypothetical protein [Pontibacter beigongshangensis]
MRNNRENKYGDFNRRNEHEQQRQPYSRFGYGNNEYRTDLGWEEERHYRQPPREGYAREAGNEGSRDDFYNRMYDTANYNAMPREEEYGRPVGRGDDFGDKVSHYPLEDEPFYEERRHLRYTMGYNPNYDNPEEGDSYRNFDSRGNHGYRHDASYGTSNEFRDFGNDHYGSNNRSNAWREKDDRYNR